MMRRRKAGSLFSLEIDFEPRRGGQEALTSAYQRLLPPLSRLARLTPRMPLREEAHDAGPRVGPKAGAHDDRSPGGGLRQGLFRSAG
jgi:hypothetical protein